MSFLEEQANESPFTREEWDRVDKQIAAQNREIKLLRKIVEDYATHQLHACSELPASENAFCYCGLTAALKEAAPPAETTSVTTSEK